MKKKRIVAFDSKDRHTRIFDLLRNRLLGAVEADAPRVIAVVAPSHGCGVSTLAVNLGFSIGRKRQSQVVVATLDTSSTLDRLKFRTSAASSGDTAGAETDKVQVDGSTIYLSNLASLAGESGAKNVARHALIRDWIDRIKRQSGPTVLILDLPPLPTSDDSAAIAPLADTVLLVARVGASTVADLETCRSALARTPHYVVLNRARRHGM